MHREHRSAKQVEAINTVERLVARQASGESRVVFGLAITPITLAITKRYPRRVCEHEHARKANSYAVRKEIYAHPRRSCCHLYVVEAEVEMFDHAVMLKQR